MTTSETHSNQGCISPPPLDDTELLLYLDQEGDDSVSAHVEQCPHCRARAEILAAMDSTLRAYAFRDSCPPAADIRDFHFNLLPTSEMSHIRQHLATCPHCIHELITDYASDDVLVTISTTTEDVRAEDPTIWEQLRLLVARLIDTNRGALRPALAVRGDTPGGTETLWTQLYQAEDNLISVSVRRDPVHPGAMELEGQASFMGIDIEMGIDTEIDTEFPALHIHLWQAEQLIASHTVDAAGDFSMSALHPGQYELIFSSPAYKIYIPDLYIGPEPPLPS